MKIKSFKAWRPEPTVVDKVASVAYDTVNREEAHALAEGNPHSFLHVTRPDINLHGDPEPEALVKEAVAALERLLVDGTLIVDHQPSLFLYRLKMGNHVQRGVVACCSVEDYRTNRIMKHEKTRQDKEDDRTRHVMALQAHTGPVFLTYRDEPGIDRLVRRTESLEPLYHVDSRDGVIHDLWKIERSDEYVQAFDAVERFYIADGHHRAAAALRAADELGEQVPESQWFLSVLFPASQLKVLGYHRVVHDLNGLPPEEFLTLVKHAFKVTPSMEAVEPRSPHEAGMYLDGHWYHLSWEMPEEGGDPVESLDVSVLQNRLLNPVLGIDDPRTSSRISFVGGIRGANALSAQIDQLQTGVAFSLYPVPVESVMQIAEHGREMPPKSTWFEPKLRSGLLIHPFAP